MKHLLPLLSLFTLHYSLFAAATTIDLSGNWSFALDPMRVGEKYQWQNFPENWDKVGASTNPDDGWDQANGWDQVTVPHCWTTDLRFREYTGYAWYRRAFQVPASNGTSTFLLDIESLGERGEVWINGTPVAKTEVAGILTTHDITAALKPGKSNLITIRADNSWNYDTIPGARDKSPRPKDQLYAWINYGGILGNITIQQVPQYHLKSQQIITTLNKDGSSTLTIAAQLSAALPNATLTLDITAPDGTTTTQTIPLTGTSTTLTTHIQNPKLWTPETPQLYRSTLTLNTGSSTHSISENFGIRTIRVADAQLLLNNKPVRYAGANRARGHPSLGGIDTPELAKQDVTFLKNAHLILSRLQHTPLSEALLAEADKQGLLIIAEIPVWGFSDKDLSNPVRLQIARNALTQMILTTRNHPSIIGWSVGNEYDSWTPEGVTWTKTLAALCKQLDPTRPVTFAALGGAITRGLKGQPSDHSYDYVDLICQNLYYQPESCARYLDRLHNRWPDKPILISEFGIRTDKAPDTDPDRTAHFDAMLQIVRTRPWLIGLAYWTLNDYRSVYQFTAPNGLRPWGLLDFDRTPRPLYPHIQKTLTQTPLK